MARLADYLRGRPYAPSGPLWERAVRRWKTLKSDEGASFERSLAIDATALRPMVTWGTSPDMVAAVDGRVRTRPNRPMRCDAPGWSGR